MLLRILEDALLERNLGRGAFRKRQREMPLQPPDSLDSRLDGFTFLRASRGAFGLSRFRLRRLCAQTVSQLGKLFKTHRSLH